MDSNPFGKTMNSEVTVYNHQPIQPPQPRASNDKWLLWHSACHILLYTKNIFFWGFCARDNHHRFLLQSRWSYRQSWTWGCCYICNLITLVNRDDCVLVSFFLLPFDHDCDSMSMSMSMSSNTIHSAVILNWKCLESPARNVSVKRCTWWWYGWYIIWF